MRSDDDIDEHLDSSQQFNVQPENVEISQFVAEVVDFSESYGSSISYSAVNICGRLSKFPAYGDFAECFSMRRYGPDPEVEFAPHDQPEIIFHDFIIVKFQNYVLPKSIKIYETYNPGAIVRILAYSVIGKRWFILWQSLPAPVEKKSREFCPKIKKMNFPTRIIRIEFNHSLIDYYTGIDGVMLTGIACDVQSDLCDRSIMRGIIQKELENVQFKPQKTPSDVIEDFLKIDLNRFFEGVGMGSSSRDTGKLQPQVLAGLLKSKREKIISDIPYEIMFKIMEFLDLKTLFQCAQVSKSFRTLSADPLLYVELNLKFYWQHVNSSLFKTLSPRCSLLKKLDLSSCGYFGSIDAVDFINFIRENGKTLTNLRLNSSQFLNTSCLEAIGIKCENLVELCLRNYAHVSSERNFVSLLTLKKLEVLDLSRSGIDSTLLSIIKNNPNLSCLNIAFSVPTLNMDEVCIQISTFNPNMKSVSLWKCHNLTTMGVRALANCSLLEELDIGWCLREETSVTECLRPLTINCKNLQKLIFAAVRGISEHDLDNIANYCANLEHLDLMGIVGISPEMCLRILQNCSKLKILDLSFCEVDENLIMIWRNEFNACIKKSEVSYDG